MRRAILLSPGLVQETGGLGVAAVGFARELAAAGIKVVLICRSDSRTSILDAATAARDGFDLHIIESGGFRASYRHFYSRVKQILAKPGRTVVWVNAVWGPQSIAAWKTYRKFGTPFIVRPAGGLGMAARRYRRAKKAVYYRLIERRILLAASAIQCMSRREMEELPDELRLKAFIAPSGVEVSSLQRPPLTKGSAIVGVLGRVHPIKRQHLALSAVRDLIAGGFDIRLEFAGSVSDARYHARLRSLVKEDSLLCDRVRFLGHVNSVRVPELVSRWQVALLLSEQENFGHSVLVTTAGGVPTIVSPGVGLGEALQESGAGCVVEPETAAATLSALLRESPDQRRAACRRFVESFRWPACGRRLLAELEPLWG